MKIAAIVAMDEGRLIGSDNAIPWRYPEDMKRFATLTTGHSVLMGHKTYLSLPEKFRPLPNRLNIVATRSASEFPEGVLRTADIFEFIKQAKADEIKLAGEILWVIGGATIYSLTVPLWDEAWITYVPGKHEGDAYFPAFEDGFIVTEEEQSASGLRFVKYLRK